MTNEFERQSFSLLGLPFDAVNMQQAVEQVRLSALQGSRLFLSTPNLNFLIASQSDPDFRQSVINSELSIADGMPVVWIARLLGIPLPGRVTGSGLIEVLRTRITDANSKQALKVFFFGGEDGIAEQACQVMNSEQGGLTCVGFYNPGFGSIEDMSSPSVIDLINQSEADFIIVSLGAKKGQTWIELNRSMLSAPVISHLGAVVNFVAGNIERAPVWMQKSGLEWIWRILQEPKLWERYFYDGFSFVRLVVTRVLPYAYWRHKRRFNVDVGYSVSYDTSRTLDSVTIQIHGDCLSSSINPLRILFRKELEKSLSIILDLSDVDDVDGAFLALCLVLYKHLKISGRDLHFIGLNKGLRRIFYWNCAEYLL